MKLVHQYMLKTQAIFFLEAGILFQDAHGIHQQVIKIDSIVIHQQVLVTGVNPPHHLVAIGA